MQQRRKLSRIRTLGLSLIVLCAICAVAAFVFMRVRLLARNSAAERYFTTDVKRTDLFPTFLASGRIESSKRTVIECELENVAVGVRGQSVAAGGAAVLLSVIPEGTSVKRGDVLAVLTRPITKSCFPNSADAGRAGQCRSRAILARAGDCEAGGSRVRGGNAEGGARGLRGEDPAGSIGPLRANDRVAWSRRMMDKGYIPAAVMTAEEFKRDQILHSLSQQETAFELFNKYTAPKTSKVLRGSVTAAATTLNYQTLRRRGIAGDWSYSRSRSRTARFGRLTTASSSTRTTPTAGCSLSQG